MPYLSHAESERVPIVDAIEAIAARLGATHQEAWRAIKSRCAAGSFTLEGIDQKARPRTIERHWVGYIAPWGRHMLDGAHIETDMPDRESGSLIAFDRQRARRDGLADEADGIKPQSLPPRRLREVVADGIQLDSLWSRAEHEFKSPDWSLGNVLSWITFNDPVMICEFEGRLDLLGYGRYDHRRSGFVYAEVGISRADQVLLNALQSGRVTAIREGNAVPSIHWFGKKIYQLADDLRFRRAEVIAIDWSQAAPREQPGHYIGGGSGKLIPLNAAIERYPENRETVMRVIETAWQAGEITLWGRRQGHAMPELIRDYHGLEITWHAAAPKGDYYAEARAHPAQLGAGYHRHEWEDLAITGADLENLYNSQETDRAFLRDNISRTQEVALPKRSAELSPAKILQRAPELCAAIQHILETGRPGKDVPWKSFCDAVRAECNASMTTRGYGDKSIERAVKEIYNK